MAFWLGIGLGVLGSLISFYPGGEAGWFGITAFFIACGLLVPGYKYKLAALLMFAICIIAAYNGYIRGIEYQEWLRTRPPN